MTADVDAREQRGREVLVVGAYFADLIFQELARPVRPGTEVFAGALDLLPGGAFTPAMAMHRLGHDVVWATDFGTDLFSSLVLSAARAQGLDEAGFRHHPVPLRSVTVALSYPGDRAMVSYQDPCVASAPPLAELLREHRPEVLMFPQLQYGEAVQASLLVARRLGTQVFMDCQDMPATLDTPTVREVLAEVDVFAPNADEALRLTGTTTVDDALDVLAGLVRTVVVKRGGEGASAVQGGKRYDVPAVPVDVVDTTGAGDCFNAGFVHALLAGKELPDCLATAVACGAAATAGPGSSHALYSAELRQWLARVPRR
ncbi:sugar/nucleoside kinase (ribokinase family) [Kitasatospora sp. MAP12-15]|uniref:carbohydrate kinase family protein n=1 Tax=unclassified Kitasatospora TaxID=2633591 RepID=UPI0024740C31|nr:carbohydrate kinase family protein [Kitasatospora sp. MAP12-44]MDH6114590.1 sugar/nucleoside kinase (ribokinase family) [Kitasatospora sp. MAP12-44]